MNFETAALLKYPELASSSFITRAQVNAVVGEYGVSYPVHIVNKTNTISRAKFHFSVDMQKVGAEVEIVPEIVETDEEVWTRIEDRYAVMEKLIKAVAENNVNSLIVAGAAGLGKSFTVNKVLNEVNGGEYGFVFHRGYLKASHLFRLLYENREQGQTVVIDDCDKVFGDEDSLNILKAALELKDVRTLGWGSEKVFVDEDGMEIPRYFQYRGNVIFLTNLDFTDMVNGSSRFAAHLSALDSRSLVVDLGIKTKREFMIKIKQTVKDGMLKNMGLNHKEEKMLMEFMDANVDRLKELSLRMCEKLAKLYKLDSKGWMKLAETSCLR